MQAKNKREMRRETHFLALVVQMPPIPCSKGDDLKELCNKIGTIQRLAKANGKSDRSNDAS